MRILNVAWRNFTSYGNKIQEIDLSGETKLCQIIGENGAGKTSISQVIMFCLYGKVEGKNLKDIVNRINGNAWTRVTLDHYGTKVVIERGISPNLLTLTLDGVPYDQAGNTEIQKYITEDILGIPYYVFNNTILLSINDFKSFIKMSPKDKRAIVDKIFGFHILNEMRDLLKSEIKKIKQSLDNIIGRVASIESTMESSLNEMESLSSELAEEAAKNIENLTATLNTFSDLAKLHEKKVKELRTEEDKLHQDLTKANRLSIEARTNVRAMETKLKLFDNDQCPTCEADLHSDFHASLKNGFEEEKLSWTEKSIEVEKTVNDLKVLDNKIRISKRELNEKGIKIQTKIKTIMSEIKVNEAKADVDSQTKSLQRIIDTLNVDHEKNLTEKFKNEERHNWIKTIDEVLSEKGVKQMAIRTILPALNSEILELLTKMNLAYQVIFDEEFNASIYHMGIEIPPVTLSTGEMKKVDFIVLIAIMKLMKMKFNNINLLFLDELFSSVDPNGVYAIVSILKEISKELGLNIFVINHAAMPHEIFDVKLEITKPNNFSTISFEEF